MGSIDTYMQMVLASAWINIKKKYIYISLPYLDRHFTQTKLKKKAIPFDESVSV